MGVLTRSLLFLLLSLHVCCSQPDPQTGGALVTDDGVRFKVESVVRNLEVPWSLAFDGKDLYFTERPGRLQVLRDGEATPSRIAQLRVHAAGEGGLMGLALHPAFRSNRLLYLSYTYAASRGEVLNRVSRYRLDGNLVEERVIVDSLPGAGVHNGCRIRFGPDGKLYITTGDAARREIAQEVTSLGGKILRVNEDGSVPADNPFPGSPIFSVGHRNGQGIAWHPVARLLFESEHGPSGFDGPGGGDEINIVEKGKNYGWPVIHHQQSSKGMISPLLEFTPAIAPGGADFCSGKAFPQFRGNLFVATLRGRGLVRVVLRKEDPREVARSETLLEKMYGRLRDVVEGPDGALYVATSNRDGRGNPSESDDQILKLVPVP